MALSKREIKERLKFVRFWADYVKKNPNNVWSMQQNLIINSAMKSAMQDAKLYLKVKKIIQSH